MWLVVTVQESTGLEVFFPGFEIHTQNTKESETGAKNVLNLKGWEEH